MGLMMLVGACNDFFGVSRGRSMVSVSIIGVGSGMIVGRFSVVSVALVSPSFLCCYWGLWHHLFLPLTLAALLLPS